MIHIWYLPILFGTGFTAGFVDSIAGGGGLITVPVLMSLGLDPRVALGTNKLQATFGSGSAAWHYGRAGAVSWRDSFRGFVLSFIGAAIGALAVQRLEPGFLKRLIPVLLLAVAVYVLFKPRLGAEDHPPRMPRLRFEIIFGLGIGFYDGFFGPGTGTFWTMACMVFLGFNMTRATAYTKVMNFASNLSALLLFLLGGYVVYTAGLVMGIGQWMGAMLGSKMVIARGTKFIRPVFLTMVFALTIKLLFSR